MKGWQIGLIIVAVLVVIASVGGCNYANGVRNDGIAFERQISAQYLSNQNELSAFVSGFYERVSVVQAQSDVLDKVLLDAVKGRYDDKEGGGGLAINSPFFAVMVEAYPEASVAQLMGSWNKVQDYIGAGREGYRAKQDKLLDMLQSYDTWRERGFVKSVAVGMFGFPSHRLEARVGNTKVTGDAARDKMYQIVLAGAALKAYETGTMEPLKVPSPR